MSDSGDSSPTGFSFDLDRWIALAGPDKVNRRKRQVAEITLHAIALEKRLGNTLVLKGGSLLAIAYGSARFTTDLDFTAREFSEDAPETLKALLDPALLRAAAALGYTDLRCRVQTVKPQPRPTTFATADAPALKITIGSADPKKANEVRNLDAGTAHNVLELDISYREPLFSIEEISLLGTVDLATAPRTLLVYSLVEVVAEKLRAYLQQRDRDRSRRQDVFDLAYLIENYGTDMNQAEVLVALRAKARARGIDPDIDMIDDPDLVGRAKRNWNTLKAEVGEIPEFEACFDVTRKFYRSLPW
jgi:predicted nucleotidyltransferase component of viral defense system